MDFITTEDLKKSLAIENNRKRIFKSGEGAGKSGSFFFFSYDNRFIIKTLRGSERKKLLLMLDSYIEHIQRTQNKSLIARVYGVYSYFSDVFGRLEVMVMQNTIHLNNKNSEKITFDLKGSLRGRKTKLPMDQDYFWRTSNNCNSCLKDVNLKLIQNDIGDFSLFQFSEDIATSLKLTIKADSQFLQRHNLMDYSLLATIEHVPFKVRRESGASSEAPIERQNSRNELNTNLRKYKLDKKTFY